MAKGYLTLIKKSLSKLITQERLDLLFNTQQKGNAYFEAAPLSPSRNGIPSNNCNPCNPLLTDMKVYILEDETNYFKIPHLLS